MTREKFEEALRVAREVSSGQSRSYVFAAGVLSEALLSLVKGKSGAVQPGDLVKVEGRNGFWPVWSVFDGGRVMIEDLPGASVGPCIVLEHVPRQLDDLLTERVFQLDAVCTWLEGIGFLDSARTLHEQRDRFLLPLAKRVADENARIDHGATSHAAGTVCPNCSSKPACDVCGETEDDKAILGEVEICRTCYMAVEHAADVLKTALKDMVDHAIDVNPQQTGAAEYVSAYHRALALLGREVPSSAVEVQEEPAMVLTALRDSINEVLARGASTERLREFRRCLTATSENRMLRGS